MALLETSFKTTVSFGLYPTLKIEEKAVTPPGVDSGGVIDVTTMRSTKWREKAGKVLLTLTTMTITAAYDATVFTQLVGMAGKNQAINVTHPDGVVWGFYGIMDKAIPGENSVDEDQPTMELTIEPSNRDGSGAESAPTVGTASPTTTTTTGA